MQKHKITPNRTIVHSLSTFHSGKTGNNSDEQPDWLADLNNGFPLDQGNKKQTVAAAAMDMRLHVHRQYLRQFLTFPLG